MIPYFTEHCSNPFSLPGIARNAHTVIDAARVRTAQAPGAGPDGLYFTPGGSEADSRAMRTRKRRWIR